MQTHKLNGQRKGSAAGFSLMELMVALAITLGIMVIAGRLLAQSMNVRARENARTEAIADVQRALQVMTREISNAGLGLTGNGLVAADSDDLQIRVRSNLNAFTESPADVLDSDEDVVYTINNFIQNGNNQRFVTRQDVNAGTISPVANRIDGLRFDYLNANGTTAATADVAVKVRITVSVTLSAVGTQGRPGYQPASRIQLVSEATLRNQMLKQ